jgi:hypothetical protein
MERLEKRLGGRRDKDMGRTGQKFFMQVAISAAVAIATPAIAASLVVGTSAAASAGTETIGSVYPTDDGAAPAINSDAPPFIATHGPTKLSVLVGNDEAAWDSAHSVHVDFRRHPK